MKWINEDKTKNYLVQNVVQIGKEIDLKQFQNFVLKNLYLIFVKAYTDDKMKNLLSHLANDNTLRNKAQTLMYGLVYNQLIDSVWFGFSKENATEFSIEDDLQFIVNCFINDGYYDFLNSEIAYRLLWKIINLNALINNKNYYVDLKNIEVKDVMITPTMKVFDNVELYKLYSNDAKTMLEIYDELKTKTFSNELDYYKDIMNYGTFYYSSLMLYALINGEYELGNNVLKINKTQFDLQKNINDYLHLPYLIPNEKELMQKLATFQPLINGLNTNYHFVYEKTLFNEKHLMSEINKIKPQVVESIWYKLLNHYFNSYKNTLYDENGHIDVIENEKVLSHCIYDFSTRYSIALTKKNQQGIMLKDNITKPVEIDDELLYPSKIHYQIEALFQKENSITNTFKQHQIIIPTICINNHYYQLFDILFNFKKDNYNELVKYLKQVIAQTNWTSNDNSISYFDKKHLIYTEITFDYHYDKLSMLFEIRDVYGNLWYIYQNDYVDVSKSMLQQQQLKPVTSIMTYASLWFGTELDNLELMHPKKKRGKKQNG